MAAITDGVVKTVEGECGSCSDLLLCVTERATHSGQEGVHVQENMVPRCLRDNLRETNTHTLSLLHHITCTL